MRRGVSSTITSDPVSSPVSGFLCKKNRISSDQLTYYLAALTFDYVAIKSAD